MLTATAAEIVVTDQPNSARSGSISTPGTARNAAAPTRARNVTAATHQAGWIRWVRGSTVTRSAWPTTDPGTTGRHANFRTDPATASAAEPVVGPSPDVTCHSPGVGARGAAIWLSGAYRRRPRSSGAAGIDVGLRLRHRGAPGCPTSRRRCEPALPRAGAPVLARADPEDGHSNA